MEVGGEVDKVKVDKVKKVKVIKVIYNNISLPEELLEELRAGPRPWPAPPKKQNFS